MGRPAIGTIPGVKQQKYSYSAKRGALRLSNRQIEKHRASIETAKVLKAVQDHVLGNRKLDPSQIRACEILLSKTMPNLSATEIDATVQDERAETMTDAQLLAIAGGLKSA